jgi:hypothetical protein
MFAPAEQFAEILESNADVAFSGSNTLINKDNSGTILLRHNLAQFRIFN